VHDLKEFMIMRFRPGTFRTILHPSLIFTLLSVAIAGQGSALAQAWPGYAGGPQHQAISKFPSQFPQKIIWSTSVDLESTADFGYLNIHYGSPVITSKNTVIVPVKTGENGGFRMEAHSGTNGALIWQLDSDYTFPPSYDWLLPFQIVSTPGPSVAMAGAGGTVILRGKPDVATGPVTRLAFYGIDNYNANPDAYNSSVQIITPITSDGNGNLYFGYLATNAPNGLTSGLARINQKTGAGTWTTAALASGDNTMQKVAYNCGPAISLDGSKVYVGVNNVNGFANGAAGYLVAVDSTTLAYVAAFRLKDVARPNNDALLYDDSTASPTVGPDGDVYYGTLENPFASNNDRGWLFHFDANLTTAKTPGAFGWDITPSIVPATAVPSYAGKSSYLILTKYNNYAELGTGDGVNQVAVQDPNDTMIDPITGATVMKTILTVVGPTPDQFYRNQGYPNAVHEWCINTAAIDAKNKRAIINSEDGNLYVWDFTTNNLTAQINLSAGLGEPYTPTIIGPDGKIYGINASILFAIGGSP
jgi:hypothetical protein